jgi:hypothetical protein
MKGSDKMKRRNLLWWLSAALVAGIGAECGDVSKSDPFPPPAKTKGVDEPPEPYTVTRDLPGHYVIALSAWLEPQYGPYRVSASAVDLNTGDQTNLTDDPNPYDDSGKTGQVVQGGKQWQHVLAYPEGHRAEINIHVQASKPGSTKGYIAARPVDRRRAGKRTETFTGTAGLSLHTIAE